MQGPSPGNQPLPYDLQTVLSPILRQLERIEERMERMDTRARDDLEGLRKELKELVAKDALATQLVGIVSLVNRVDDDRKADKKTLQDDIAVLKQEQFSRQERFWLRISAGGTALAVIISLFELLTHIKLAP